MMDAVCLRPKAGVRSRLPIIAHYATEIPAAERERIGEIAAEALAEEPRLTCEPPFGPYLASGMIEAPSLVIEDHSAIQLAHERGADEHLSYRALLLAGEGDLLALYGARIPKFEEYCRDMLGLGKVKVIAPDLAGPEQALSLACIEDRALIGRAVEIARDSGGLNVLPYMATGGTWRLAGEIAQRARVPVRVAGPPPRLVRAANDKLWFAEWAARLLGKSAVPPCRSVCGMAALVGHLHRFMRAHDTVALKLSHSAASLGNMVIESSSFDGLSPVEAAGRLDAMMRERGWSRPFPLQLTAWEGPLAASPSAQLWIPKLADGPPIVEGIFDQIVAGTTARFTGAVPSRLSQELRQQIADEAARMGLLFQMLGYFGRCSFDAVVIENGIGDHRVHWVECNGRWGGVSIPMTVANRLIGDWNKGDMLVMGRRYQAMQVDTVGEFLARFRDALFEPGLKEDGAVLLAPGRIEGGGVEFLFVGRDPRDVQLMSEDLLGRLEA